MLAERNTPFIVPPQSPVWGCRPGTVVVVGAKCSVYSEGGSNESREGEGGGRGQGRPPRAGISPESWASSGRCGGPGPRTFLGTECPRAKTTRSGRVFGVGVRSPGVDSAQSVAGKSGGRRVWDQNEDALPGSMDVPLEAVTGEATKKPRAQTLARGRRRSLPYTSPVCLCK